MALYITRYKIAGDDNTYATIDVTEDEQLMTRQTKQDIFVLDWLRTEIVPVYVLETFGPSKPPTVAGTLPLHI